MRHACHALLSLDLLFNIARWYFTNHGGGYLAFIMLEELHVHHLLLIAFLSVDSASRAGNIRHGELRHSQ